MASGVRIDSISSLADLSGPENHADRRIRAAAVTQFASKTCKKRKRSEIVACLDGKAINIYNVGIMIHDEACY
jgi:hypothetical protein